MLEKHYQNNRRMKKMKKKILIVLAIIIVIAFVAIGYMVISDWRQEEKLNTELEELSSLTNAEEIDIEQIEERLNRTVTTGDYEVVERAFKQYLSDNFDNMIQIADILNDERMITLLTAENYEKDGPEFTETKKYLTETKQKLEELKNTYVEFYTEEKVMSYINDKGLDEYYVDYYKNEIVGDIASVEEINIVESSIDEVVAILEKTEEVIDLLIENNGAWQVENGNIVFESDSLSNQYNELIAQL